MTAIQVARLLLAAGLLLGLWFGLDGGAALARLADIHPGWALAGLAALLVQTMLSAARWRLTAASLGLDLGRAQVLREYFIGQMLNQILPGGVVGDIGRAWRSAVPGGMLRAGQAVAIERMMGNAMLLAVMLLGICGAALGLGGPALPADLLRSILLVLVAIGAGLVAVMLALPRILATGEGARILAETRAALQATLRGRGVISRQIALNLGAVLANLAAFAFAARATGSALSPVSALVLLPLILFAMLVPLTISGWGIREGAAAALFPLAGFSPEAGLAASLAFGLLFLGASLPGLVLLLPALLRPPRRADCRSSFMSKPSSSAARNLPDALSPPVPPKPDRHCRR